MTVSGDKLNGGITPVPIKATIDGLPGRLLLMVRFATRLPAAVGVKVTFTVQLLPEDKELGQVLVWAKSLAFAPVMAIDEMLARIFPVFVSVTACERLVVPVFWFPKLRLLGVGATPSTTCDSAADVLGIRVASPL